MRNIDSHLLDDKMDEAVTHYINSQHNGDHVHVDTNTIALNVQDEGGGRVVTVMHPQGYSTQMCRQALVGEQVGEGPWGDELLDPDGRIAAIVAHLAQQSRNTNSSSPHHKVSTIRSDVESTVMLDGQMRLFNVHGLDQHPDPIVVQVPSLHPLPSLQDMKRCQDASWFNNKTKADLKGNSSMLPDSDPAVLELSAGASPVQLRQQSKKNLPHKKRISRKLKRTPGNRTPQQDIVIINNSEDVQHEEILPDNFVSEVHQQEHLPEDSHHIEHDVRSVFICQLCGEYCGEDQFKFYQHLKQHYEPHDTIIIENPVADLGIDKMTNTCIVDNVSTLPDSIVELSLDNTVPKSMYGQTSMDKHIMYTSSDKTLNYSNNKVQYSIANTEKDTSLTTVGTEKSDLYDENLDKFDFYCCSRCNKSFKKQKQCEMHLKEGHCSSKLEDISEFSEPEDLMEGIHVSVDEAGEQYEPTLLPHLTVENGHVHQEHVRHWYARNGAPSNGALPYGEDGYNLMCPTSNTPLPTPGPNRNQTHSPHQLKEEMFQRILEVEEGNSDSATNFTDNIIPENGEVHQETELHHEEDTKVVEEINVDQKKPLKVFHCEHCPRSFAHRNSLIYHTLSHSGKQQVCRECGKSFYTAGALKIHKRVHNDDRPYKCDVCGREFRQWSDLKYHKVSLHSGQKPFKCDFCDKEFARKYSLSVHRRIHTGERNYKCEYCNKTFRASSYRLSHMRTHTGVKPYKCDDCDKCFRVAGDLRRHKQTHEKVRNRLDELKKANDTKEIKKAQNKFPENTKYKEITTQVNNELLQEEQKISPIKKIALASTTRLPVLKNVAEKKANAKPTKKNLTKKIGAPNVTINDTEYTNEVEIFDTRQVGNGHYIKYKDMYDSDEYNKHHYKQKNYDEQIINGHKDEQRLTSERELTMLRPAFRDDIVCEDDEKTDFVNRIDVYTHVDKINNGLVPGAHMISDRHFDREVRELRTDTVHGENIENGFFERLTALYNIPAV